MNGFHFLILLNVAVATKCNNGRFSVHLMALIRCSQLDKMGVQPPIL